MVLQDPNVKNAIVDVTGGLEQFKSKVASHHAGLVAVHFWADWAQQCGPMDEALKILAADADLASVLFLRVEAENEADISMDYEVAAVPTFLFFGKNKLLGRVEGAKVADVTRMVREHSAQLELQAKLPTLSVASAEQKLPGGKDLNTRLKELINASPAMLFIKGSPGAPECGFSRQTVALLNGLNAVYGYFDILRDNEVRQGLKEYSKWPTFPQLYVNGELIGGLDILKEMNESGDLDKILPKKTTLDERLKFLVRKANVVIFMKGNPEEPKCGFSRHLMELVKPLQVPFETFDILEDEEVRQGLKKFSNWPTYPQVYVKGELVGGLDIVKELKESGELEATLKGH